MRSVLITGASRGIGNSIAKRLLEDGHRISIGIRKGTTIKGELNKKVEMYSKNMMVSEYDSLSKKLADKWVDKTIKNYGSIDTIIHCAGIFRGTKFLYEESEEADIEQLWRVNVLAPWYLTRIAWKYLISNKESRVITLVSLSGKRSKGNLAGYSMSKFALMSLCQTMRNEGWNHGLRVTAICPSWVNTDMAKNINTINKSEMTQPEDIASICSNIISLPNSCVPFEISINCNLEK